MKILASILLCVCAHQVASASVVVYHVPRPPSSEGVWITNTTEFDFNENSLPDMLILEGNTICVGNEVSVRCSVGFRVTLGSAIQVFASTEFSQVLPGTIVSESILGTEGSWSNLSSLYLEYYYGTVGSGYTADLIAERFSVPIRFVDGSGYRYGFLEINMLEQIQNPDGSTSEIIRPHVIGVGLETDVDTPVSAFAIPEPSCLVLTASGLWLIASTRRRKAEQISKNQFDGGTR